MEVVTSTTPIPKSNYREKIPRKVHLATLGATHLRSLVEHGLTEIEPVASTMPISESDCPL